MTRRYARSLPLSRLVATLLLPATSVERLASQPGRGTSQRQAESTGQRTAAPSEQGGGRDVGAVECRRWRHVWAAACRAGSGWIAWSSASTSSRRMSTNGAIAGAGQGRVGRVHGSPSRARGRDLGPAGQTAWCRDLALAPAGVSQELVQGWGCASSTGLRRDGELEEGSRKRALRNDGNDAPPPEDPSSLGRSPQREGGAGRPRTSKEAHEGGSFESHRPPTSSPKTTNRALLGDFLLVLEVEERTSKRFNNRIVRNARILLNVRAILIII